MPSRIVREKVRRDNQFMGEKQRGLPGTQMRLSSARVAETLVPHLSRLSCVTSNTQMQNADGTFKTLAGYSRVGGPDS